MPKSQNKPNRPVSMTTYVDRIIVDVAHGRLMDAAYCIFALGKKQAVVVAAHVLDQVRDNDNYAAFLRVLDSFFDD